MSELRIMTAQDRHRSAVVELGRRFLHEGVYSGIIEDAPDVAKGIADFVAKSPDHGRVILAVQDLQDGKIEHVVGVFAFFIHPGLYTGKPTAGELIWYVAPEYRKGGVALRLLAEAEKQAKEMGAQYMTLTAPTEDVGRLYGRCGGYRQVEVAFQRRLN